MPGHDDATTARLILAEANRAHSARFELVHRLNGGFQGGTWLLQDRSESLAVLKWSLDQDRPERVSRAAAAVRKARAGGYSTPEWSAFGRAGDGFAYHIMPFVPGSRATVLTAGTARLLVPLLESQRGLDVDPEHCWSRYVRGSLAGEADDARRTVAGSSAHGRRLVAALDALVTASADARLPTGDLVHGDFRLGNVMFSPEGTPTAVDAEALGSGTRVYDYATLLTEDDVETAGWEVIRAAGERVAGPHVLARCFALTALELAAFICRHRPGRLPVVVGPLTERAMALRPDIPQGQPGPRGGGWREQDDHSA